MITYTQTLHSSRIEVTPDISAIGSVIWLHGLGADGHDFVSAVPQLDLSSKLALRFIFPHAPLMPVTINNGYVMRAWFDIYSLQIDQRLDESGIANSVKLVEQLIKSEQDKGISTDKIILAGFSQGSVIALLAGLGYAQKLGGVIALSGYLPPKLLNVSQANQSLPVFLAHGTEDEVVPFRLGQATAVLLKQHGVPVTRHEYAMAHSVCREEVTDIARWLGNTIRLD